MTHNETRETAQPTPVFTEDDDYTARAGFWFGCSVGSLVQTPDGEFWTVVYSNLDGFGVVAGDRPEFINAPDDKLIEHTHLLREMVALDKPCLGSLVHVWRRVKENGDVIDHSAAIRALSLTETEAPKATIAVGQHIGVRKGPPVGEEDHYMKCANCGGYLDMRDLADVFSHEAESDWFTTARNVQERLRIIKKKMEAG